jgi:hypothetical protein
VALILLLTVGPKAGRVIAGLLFPWSAIVTALNPVAGPLTLTAPLTCASTYRRTVLLVSCRAKSR